VWLKEYAARSAEGVRHALSSADAIREKRRTPREICAGPAISVNSRLGPMRRALQPLAEDATPPPASAEIDRDRAERGLRIVGAPELAFVLDGPRERLLDDLLGLPRSPHTPYSWPTRRR
jgi:hypothetical protein